MSPTDPKPADEEFSRLLAACDEALAAGDVAPPPQLAAAPELQARLERARACLLRLERVRRRSTLQQASGDTPGPSHPVTEVGALPLQALGRFEVRRELGRGGGGIVLLAFDPLLRREVAVKVPRPEAILTAELRRRFLREARAAAGLEHPNLVTVHEVGEDGPLCYLVSTYCRGPSLAAWLKQQRDAVPPRDAAALVATLADAVHFMHGRGIIHRDIKPGNILLVSESNPGVATPGLADYQPRLTDFGLARPAERDDVDTRTGAVLGTPTYMAPEQAEGDCRVGPATDVYALGVLLYELLTGRPPFRAATTIEVLRQVVHDEPEPPARLRAGLSRDLESVCLKCLEKEPHRRYASAAALADDLRKYLSGRATSARPLTAWQRGYRSLRRRPRPAITLSAGLLGVLALTGLWWYVSAVHDTAETVSQERDRVETEAKASRQRVLYAREMGFLSECAEQGRLTASQFAGTWANDLRGFEWHFLRRLADADPAGTEWFVGRGHTQRVHRVAISSDGRLCASASDDRSIIVWDLATQSRRWSASHKEPVHALAFSPDGKTVASGYGRGPNHFAELKLWDVATGTAQAAFPVPGGQSICNLAFAPDGKTLASVSDAPEDESSRIRLWDLRSGQCRALPAPLPGTHISVVFSPDGKTLAVGYGQGPTSVHPDNPRFGAVLMFDVATGTRTATLTGHPALVQWLAFTPDGKTLVSGDIEGTVKIWDAVTLQARLTLNAGTHLALSPDGTTLAAMQAWRDLRLWDVATGRSLARVGSVPPAHCVRFGPTGTQLAVACDDGTVRLLDVRNVHDLPGHRPDEAWAVAFAPDGKTLATAGDDHSIRVWSVADFRQRDLLAGHTRLVTSVAFSPDGKTLASGSFDRTVRLWDTATGQSQSVLLGHTQDIRAVAFSPDGRLLAAAAKSVKDPVGELRIWDRHTGKERLTLAAHGTCLAFSGDGRLLAFRGVADAVELLDVATLTSARVLPESASVSCVTFTPDSQTLVTAGTDGLLRFWDTATGSERPGPRTLAGSEVRALAFSPDGKTLASAGMDRSIRLCQAASRLELFRLKNLPDYAHALAFSPDSTSLAAACHDGTVRLYQGKYGR